MNPNLTLDEGIRATADYYGVSVGELTRPTRTSSLVWLRHVAMYMAHRVALIPYERIAPAFGVKSAAGVFNAVLNIASRKGVASDIEALRTRLCPPPAHQSTLEPWELPPVPSPAGRGGRPEAAVLDAPAPEAPVHASPPPARVDPPGEAPATRPAWHDTVTPITASPRWSGTALPPHTLCFTVRTA